jgi:hypothetical protein
MTAHHGKLLDPLLEAVADVVVVAGLVVAGVVAGVVVAGATVVGGAVGGVVGGVVVGVGAVVVCAVAGAPYKRLVTATTAATVPSTTRALRLRGLRLRRADGDNSGTHRPYRASSSTSSQPRRRSDCSSMQRV